jgi:phospholipase/lecithinase/hemolysin
MLSLLPPLALLLASVHSASITNRELAGRGQSTWSASRFNSLVSFGDSYTDENRLNYFGEHNGSAPPAGTFLPESFSTAGGGRTWVRYVIQYTGAEVGGQWEPSMTLYDYAVSGAVCSNFITPR